MPLQSEGNFSYPSKAAKTSTSTIIYMLKNHRVISTGAIKASDKIQYPLEEKKNVSAKQNRGELP